ncbi:hypothetical protein [Paracidovorax cattleyae]|uniref:hypothetical protein n=1 Tax=Paracidovorax cattleyae TaxID=80868 RepID=UPI0018AF8EE8|nr:hypothetical protein [Paracidovorax cattleyae]MBF9263938.1 hypothetical protein [Paracidovorax cattleyae]UYL85488.1 hypothetical protein gp33 [Acidovorax phage Aval]
MRQIPAACVAFIGAMSLVGCDRPPTAQDAPVPRPQSFQEHIEENAPPSPGIVANATVTMSPETWACPAQEDVWAALQHQNQGETAAARNIISSRCLSSWRVLKEQTWTVLVVRGALANISAETAGQYLLAERGGYDKKTYWIPAHWLTPAS